MFLCVWCVFVMCGYCACWCVRRCSWGCVLVLGCVCLCVCVTLGVCGFGVCCVGVVYIICEYVVFVCQSICVGVCV